MNGELRLTEAVQNAYRATSGMNWAEFDADGNCIRENDPKSMFGAFPAELKETVKNMIQNLPVKPFSGDVYIRFNDVPKSGKSTNWAEKRVEKGLSAYETYYDVITGTYTTCGALPGAELTYLIKNAPIYFVTGKEIARGSDGEPLLTDVEILGKAVYTDKGYAVK